jgi:hypothetical protein
MTERMPVAKFEVNDDVRFIGTDAVCFVTKCHKTKREYQIQRGNDRANRQWVTEVYLELVEPAGLGHAYRFRHEPRARMIDAFLGKFSLKL